MFLFAKKMKIHITYNFQDMSNIEYMKTTGANHKASSNYVDTVGNHHTIQISIIIKINVRTLKKQKHQNV